MANQEHLDLLKQGVEVWNQWRKEHADIGPDLSEAELSGVHFRKADLTGANLFNANFTRADLSEANLRYAHLIDANLSGADLTGANLFNANFTRADLMDANFNGAHIGFAFLMNANLSRVCLNFANLIGANLEDADLSGTILGQTIFAEVDLCSVKGLAEVDHKRPSIVQLHTVQLPPDGSTLHFLRGTGLPDEWIDFYRASMMHPIVYHSCFIRYSSKDEDFAKRLHTDLQAKGVRCWFAPHELIPGTLILEGIDKAIRSHDKLLLILSEHSVKSAWVKLEVEAALYKEVSRNQLVLFPIRLDNTVLESTAGWAVRLHQRHIGDFTQWKDHDAYQKAFTRLLRDLKTEAQKPQK